MNFNGVMKITIPEGSVKKIECAGKVLWEKAPELVCNPHISITYKSKVPISEATYRNSFSCSISGITRALISDVQIRIKYYRETMTGTQSTQYSYNSYALPDDAITENGYSFSHYASHSVPSSLYYGHSFALCITYTDLDGNQKTLTTNYVSSVGAGANASV